MAEIQVSTWSEFVSAIGTSGADVVVAEGQTWDMNSIQPEGFTTSITISAASIAGNGLKIKNLTFKNGGKFACAVDCTISGISHENALIEGDATTALYAISGGKQIYFDACKFSGKVVDSNAFRYDGNQTSYDGSRLFFNRCAINLEHSGNSAFVHTVSGSYNYATFRYCNIKTEGSGTRSCTITVDNSLFTGDLIYQMWINGGNNIKSYYSIFDLNVPTDGGLRVNSNYTANVVKCLYNSDKVETGGTVNSPLIGVTSEQLQSASYLGGLGFPIGED